MHKLDTLLYHTTNLKAKEEVFSNFYLLWEILLMVWPYVVSTEIRNMYALTWFKCSNILLDDRLATRIRRMWQRSHLLSRRLSLSFRMCSVQLLRETSTLGMDWGSASSQLPALNTGSSPSDETNDNYHATNHYFFSLIIIIIILVRLLINVSHLCLYISTIVIETMWPFLLSVHIMYGDKKPILTRQRFMAKLAIY